MSDTTSTAPAVRVEPTRYSVSILPETSINHGSYEITVEYRGAGRWAVCNGGSCLDAAGEWEYESIPSEREDEWLAAHRFDLDAALRLAREAAPDLTVNGWSVAKAMELEARHG